MDAAAAAESLASALLAVETDSIEPVVEPNDFEPVARSKGSASETPSVASKKTRVSPRPLPLLKLLLPTSRSLGRDEDPIRTRTVFCYPWAGLASPISSPLKGRTGRG